MIRSCLLEIQNRYEELTPAEKRVAEYIQANGPQVIHMSVRDLAEQAGVAKSAVPRCCQSLGFSGFPDLKISLTADLTKNQKMNFSSHISDSDDIESVLDKVFSSKLPIFTRKYSVRLYIIALYIFRQCSYNYPRN